MSIPISNLSVKELGAKGASQQVLRDLIAQQTHDLVRPLQIADSAG